MSMQAQVRTADGVILAVGLFPAGSPDPGIEIVTIADAEAEKLSQPGPKTYSNGTVTVGTPPPPEVVFGRAIAIKERRVTTTGTTPAELLRATIPPLTGYQARLRLTAISDNLLLRSIEALVVVGRGANGATIIQNAAGQNQTVLADHRTNATAGSWLIVPSVDGNDYVITVTGSAGRTVQWRLVGSVESFTPGGEA